MNDESKQSKDKKRKRKQARKAEQRGRDRLLRLLDAKESMSFQSEDAFRSEF